MTAIPDRLLTQDLLLREPTPEERLSLPDHARALEPLRVIEVRSSGKLAGYAGREHGRLWLELMPEHQRKGRGSEALSVWLEAMLQRGDTIEIDDVDHPIARDFMRKFGFDRVQDRWRSTDRTRQRLSEILSSQLRRYRQRVTMTLLELGIPSEYGIAVGLPVVAEARALDSIGRDIFDREQYMLPPAAAAFRQLQTAAADDDVDIQPVSAFRGFDYQVGLITRKLKTQPIDQILRVTAAPGFSEHHTGRAVDVTHPAAEALEESFATTDAFAWMQRHAGEYGFHLSYPEDNPHGIAYEPWHWCYRESELLAYA